VRPDGLFAGRYRLERRLGVGGMATVQLAFDTRLERHVAVKLLAEHLAEDSNFVSRFRREALAAARLVHPNIVQVFDFGLDDSTHRNFIVMEYVDGQSCAEILREQGPLRPNEAVDILAQSCRGLDYAHRNGVVHRDVKPGNLMRSAEGMVKLADFGIAKAAEDSDITKVGSVLGTAAYLAPEQARGEAAGPPSDLYALGVVAYQLMAGRLPYEAGSLTDLARLQESGPPQRLDELEPEVPAALAAAVARALHRDPERRYADAAEMEQALRDGLRGRAPIETDATWAVGDETAATRMLTGTSATSAMPRTAPGTAPHRRLEPLDEPPAAPRRPPARRASAPPPRKRRGGALRLFVALLVVLALAAAGFAGYQALEDSSSKAVQLREDVTGKVENAIEQLRGLIDDNTQ
jgi:serine/threonine protein kinase